MLDIPDISFLNQSVVFLDKPLMVGEPHLWIREYFADKGYDIVETPWMPWVNSDFDMNAACEVPFEIELDMSQIMRMSVAQLKGFYRRTESIEELTVKFTPHLLSYWKKIKDCIFETCPQIIVINGNYPAHCRLAAMLAEKMAIKVLALENSYLRECFNLEATTGLCCNYHSLGTWAWQHYKNYQLTLHQKKKLYDFFNKRIEGLYVQKKLGLLPEKLTSQKIYKELNIPKTANIAMIIGQVAHDSVISCDLNIFDSLIDFIISAVDCFAVYENWYVIVRLHPLEEQFGNPTAKMLQKHDFTHDRFRIVRDQEFNTYSIMDAATFGVTVNSQAGLEMVSHGKPVIVCGDCFYGGKGFTLDVTQREFFPAAVKILIKNQSLSEQQKKMRDRFLYWLIFKFLCWRNREAVFERLNEILKDSFPVSFVGDTRRENDDNANNNRSLAIQDYPHIPSQIKFSTGLQRRLCKKRILIYGIGTVTILLLKKLDNCQITLCSGVESEIGKKYEGMIIQNIFELILSQFDFIFIVARFEGRQLYRENINPRLSKDFLGETYIFETYVTSKKCIYKCLKM